MMTKTALCIGINDYPGTASDLRGCVNDVDDWSRELKSRGFTVEKLTNSKAKRAEMRSRIAALVKGADYGDCVVIVYSGHGSFVEDLDGDEPDGTDECLCPYDTATKGVITDDDLYELYSARERGVRLIMISDSCHSGTVAKFNPIVTPPTLRGRGAPERKVRFLPPGAFLSKRKVSALGSRGPSHTSSPPGRHAALLLSGCQDSEFSYDAYFEGRPNGAFSFVALKALKKLPKHASYRDWYEQIRKMLPSQQYPQTPNLYGGSWMKKWAVFSTQEDEKALKKARKKKKR